MQILRLSDDRYLAYFFGNPAFMVEITHLTSEGMMIPYLINFADKL
jgi:hypothetical protein